MSGIAGVFQLDGRPLDEVWIRRMTDALAHRGPDGTGVWAGDAVGLGHRMLHVTPESLNERQPLAIRAAELVVTADARIDNREELLRLLGRRERAGDPVTDSELILAAYERWGPACPERLVGDFAFAIWDARTRTLFCARDPIGVKPFYYFRSGRLFAFASEIRALLSLPEVPRRVNELQVACYLSLVEADREITFYEDIVRLPAANSLRVDSASVRRQCYWSLDAARDVRFSSDGEYVEGFREVFTASVNARLRSAFPVGAALSGGLDSSSIVGVARDLLRQQNRPVLKTFSAIFPSAAEVDLPGIDERPYIDAVAAMGGVEAHHIRADRMSPLQDIDRVLWHLEEPPFAPNLYMHWGLYQAASSNGARVFLDGIDGDSAINHGFGRLTDLARARHWEVFVSELRLISQNWNVPIAEVIRHYGLPYLDDRARANRWIAWAGAAAVFARRFSVSWKRMVFRHGINHLPISGLFRRKREAANRGFIAPSFAREIGLEQRCAELRVNEPWSGTEREGHIASLESPRWQFAMEVADRAATAFSIETRYPFFDRRLMEFCVALPSDQKLANGWSRFILRRAMEGILPASVQWRGGKGNLSSNFYRGFLQSDALLIREVLSNREESIGRYIDVPRAREQYERAASTGDRRTASAVAPSLFLAVTLGQWLLRARTPPQGCSEGGHASDPDHDVPAQQSVVRHPPERLGKTVAAAAAVSGLESAPSSAAECRCGPASKG